MPERTTDETLLERAGAGESAAFLQLYQRHRDQIFRFAYRLSGSAELAEDITHDCFLSLIRRPEGFRPGRAALRTYLLGAARNLWLKQLRTQSRESELDELTVAKQSVVKAVQLDGVLEKELSRRVQEAVSNLPPMQREALVLFEFEGLALHEIAALVETDVGAVKARLHRARQGLKSALQTYLNSNSEIVTLEKV